MPIMERVVLRETDRFQEVSPVGVDKQASEIFLVGKRYGHVDLLASQGVRARKKRDHAYGERRLARRKIQHDCVVPALLTLANAGHELAMGESIDPADETDAILLAQDNPPLRLGTPLSRGASCVVEHGGGHL